MTTLVVEVGPDGFIVDCCYEDIYDISLSTKSLLFKLVPYGATNFGKVPKGYRESYIQFFRTSYVLEKGCKKRCK